ncbi:MDR family MFS transporter [Allostreptomyces psammosilenae]|uniref:EmrB/QacA subfamily drug resistance transporter n=1 Tax=Allostreptomyces psammosilenae TaxID=1892865 RepID=A0A853ABJ4_9ACTN|nr:MDR family MFS transporter [Allostreptomyces psammosilenae]NYI07971.1 EmrB/QacA subfamily drug resistance transporter [Allostreptomyces psammosilenae]
MATNTPASTPQAPPEQAVLTPREILVAMSGLVIAMLLAMLDNMIVAPALPTIVGDLGGLDRLAWVTTAYILASTAATPIWGKLGDLYGRKGVFMSAVVIFLVGSALCGVAQDMNQLIAFRALQGLGAGGLMVGVMAIIGEMVPPRERGRYQGVMAAVMPIAMIGGPLVGGFITDNLNWRWAFYVNLPLGAVALAVIWFTLKLPRRTRAGGRASIDWSGAALLTLWITTLVLITSWGGTEYAWGSGRIIGLGVVTVLGFVAFLIVERRAVEPVMPLSVFRNANFSLAGALSFIVGFAMFGGVTFLPQFQQFVQGSSATNSGLLLMPMMISAMAVSVAGGLLITRTGRYRALPIAGGALLTAGLALMSTMELDTSRTTSALYMIVLGAGMGCLMQTTMLIAQNSVALRDMGAATGASTFLRNMGGSLGVSLLGSLYTNRLRDSLEAQGGGAAAGTEGLGSIAEVTPEVLRQMAEPVRHAFQVAVTEGIQVVFVGSAVVAAVGFVLAWFIRHVPLRGSGPAPSAPRQDDPVPVEAGAAKG